MKYRKKPIEIEAFQYDGEEKLCKLKRGNKLPSWYKAAFDKGMIDWTFNYIEDELTIKTLEGTMIAYVGDYIVQGINGELYPVKKEIFEKTYEKV